MKRFIEEYTSDIIHRITNNIDDVNATAWALTEIKKTLLFVNECFITVDEAMKYLADIYSKAKDMEADNK